MSLFYVHASGVCIKIQKMLNIIQKYLHKYTINVIVMHVKQVTPCFLPAETGYELKEKEQ